MADAAPAGPPAFDMGAFIQGMTYLKITYYMTAIALVSWLWDILLTLDDEISLVWKRKGTLIKTLYFLNRYFPTATLALNMLNTSYKPTKMTDFGCKARSTVVIFSQTIAMIIAPTIFVIRVYTISVSHPILRRVLVMVTVASHMAIFAFTVLGLQRFIPTLVWNDMAGFCLGEAQWAFGAVFCIPLLIDSLVFFATVYHAICYHKTSSVLERTPTTFILYSLYFDGAIYYFIVLAIRIINAVLYFGPPQYFTFTLSFLDLSLTSTVTSRWFLAFRRAVVNSQNPKHASGYASGRPDGGLWTSDSISAVSGPRTAYFPMNGVIRIRAPQSHNSKNTSGNTKATGTGTGTISDGSIKKLNYDTGNSSMEYRESYRGGQISHMLVPQTRDYGDMDVLPESGIFKEEYVLPDLPSRSQQRSRHDLDI